MSPLFEQGVVFSVMSILVTLFTWIYLRDRRQKVGLWMLGWIAIFIHFAVPLPFMSALLSSNMAAFLKISTLEVAAVSFLLSVSEVHATRKKRLLFILLVGVPALLYLACLLWRPQSSVIFAALLGVSGLFVLIHACLYYGRKSLYLYGSCLLIMPYWLWGMAQALRHRPIHGLIFFLSMLFGLTGVLYWRHFNMRLTPGVITTSLSFVAWGLVFPGARVLHAFNAGPPNSSVFWDLPKYFVAFGMILTLFENETAVANSVAGQYQVLFEGNLASVYVSTFEGQLVDCNSAFITMYGFQSRQEALASSAISLYSEAGDREHFLHQLRKDGQLINYECPQRRTDGSIFWVLERATVFTMPSGQKLIEGTAIDITERRHAEIALKQSEERFSTIFRHNPIACGITSLEGVFLNVNEALLQLVGLPAEQVIGLTVLQLGAWKSRQEQHSFFRKLRAKRSVRNLKIQFRDAAGSEHVGLFFGTIVRIGEKECVFGMFLDRTEQRDLEAKFLQAQKMDALGRLAGGVAHDFNNLLGVIGGYAELLETEMVHDQNHQRRCQTILETVRRASGLTRQLLAFSRKEITQTASLKPDAVLRELAGMLSRVIGEDIELNLDLCAAGTVLIDKTQFEQVIINIVVNARDAMPGGGRLTIKTEDKSRTAMLSSGDVSSSQYVGIVIADTGMGMDEETQLRAFEPFFTTKGLGRGTGLGLATVYGIVQQCDGEISIESRPGEGTRITILLPSGVEPKAGKAQERDCGPVRGEGYILLVEDETELRNATAEFLTAVGYSVISAAGGPEALQLACSTEQIDLVITDVVMPKMNGREFADQLLEIRPGTKVLFVSGYTDDVVLRTGISSSGTAFLQKPVSFRELAARVHELISPECRRPAGCLQQDDHAMTMNSPHRPPNGK